MQQPPPPAPPKADPKAQTLAAASRVIPEIEFLHVVSIRPSEVCLVARQHPSADAPEPEPFIVYLFRPVTDPEHLQHFRDSAKQLMAIEHSSLGIPFKFDVAAGHPYFFVKIPPGSSLSQLQKANQLQPAHVVHVIPEVCIALSTAHEAGVSHHSLTPDDVIIAPDGSVTLLRLGFTDMLARTPEERLAFVADTPPELRHYLAPEQNDVNATPDFRTDIYTIGSILYELFTGRKIGGFFILPSSVSKLERRVDDLISIALQHSAENRFKTVAEFGTYLTTVRSAEVAAVEDDERLSNATSTTYFSTHTVTGTSPFKRVLGIVLALLVIAGGCTALYYEFVNDPGPDQELIDRLLAMQELNGTAMSAQELAEAYAQIGEVMGEVGPDKETILIAINVMQRLGDPAASQKVLDDYINSLPEGTESFEELVALRDEFGLNIEEYLVAMEEAAIARSTGDDAAELAALQKALSFLPDDCHAQKFLGENPIHIDRQVGTAMADLRKQTSPENPLTSSYVVRRGAVDIDISNNPELFDLSPLASLPIEELDISNTAVKDLSPVAGMFIRKLWLDDTQVADLSPLVGMPLETLAFEHCPVEDPTVIDSLELLTTVRYTSASGQREFRIPTPTSDKPWENDLGMRFVPLEISGNHLLVGRWETRIMDFNEFVSNAGTRLENSAPGTPSWDNPEVALGTRYPVSAVSLQDAKAFCKWLTGHSLAAGILPASARFRLPTDYEWSVAAGLDEHPMLSPAVRALQGSPFGARTTPGLRPVGKTAAAPSGIHGLWENVREWTGTTLDSGTQRQFAVRGIHSIPAPDAPENATIEGDLRTRYGTHALERSYDTGFRVVLDLGDTGDRPIASLPELIASGEREAAKKLAVDLVHNSDDFITREAARMYVELEEVESHFKKFRRLPPGLKEHVKYYQGRRYCLAKIPLDWNTANKFAVGVGGHLATLSSAEELEWALENFTNPRDVETIWVGVTPAGSTSSVWVWQSTPDSTNLPIPEDPIAPSERLLLLPAQNPPTPPAEGERPTPPVWHQAPGHQRHFFLIEWG